MSKTVPRSLFLIQLSKPANRLEIQNVPLSLDYDFKNKYVAIHSPGRNNPFYHYTGSEDTLEFDLSWYAQEEDRIDVIRNCKWLESISKNDGYKGPVEAIAIDWSSKWARLDNSSGNQGEELGTPPGSLFQFGVFLIESAPFSLKLFHGSRNMMPCLATQKVKLIRTTAQNQSRIKVGDYRY